MEPRKKPVQADSRQRKEVFKKIILIILWTVITQLRQGRSDGKDYYFEHNIEGLFKTCL